MKKIFWVLALSGSLAACTGGEDGQPTEIPNPSAAVNSDGSRLSGSATEQEKESEEATEKNENH